MARLDQFVKKNNMGQQEMVKEEVIPVTPDPAPVSLQQSSTELLSSQHSTTFANDVTADFTLDMTDPEKHQKSPGEESQDATSKKDHLLFNHAARIGNSRRFMTDGLCRALNTDMYLENVDKIWAKNPLGKGPDQPVRYSREFPRMAILFDKFDLMPDTKILDFKRKLAHDHGYKYVYETPAEILTHDRLTVLLEEQKLIKADN